MIFIARAERIMFVCDTDTLLHTHTHTYLLPGIRQDQEANLLRGDGRMSLLNCVPVVAPAGGGQS